MESVQNFFKDLYARIDAHIRAHPRRSGIIAGTVILLILGFIIPMDPPHVSLSGEPIFQDGPKWLTNSAITTIVVDLILILMAVAATARMKVIPSGWQNFIEVILEYLYNLSESVSGKDARKFFPWVATIFLFIIIANWIGLVPGVSSVGFYHETTGDEGAHAQVMDRQLKMENGNLLIAAPAQSSEDEEEEEHSEGNGTAEEEHHAKFVPLFRAPTADLNTTFGLAIATMVMVQIWGFRVLGGSYVRKFFTFRGEGFMRYINSFVGILELVSEFSRTIAFGFRLFGNIFAGEVVLATMAFLIAFILPVPFYILELFVGAVQALVFMMLALIFFTMATISHEHDH